MRDLLRGNVVEINVHLHRKLFTYTIVKELNGIKVVSSSPYFPNYDAMYVYLLADVGEDDLDFL